MTTFPSNSLKNMKKIDSYLNQQDLLDHAKNPLNYGVLEKCDFTSGEYNPSCGDSVSIYGIVSNNVLKQVRFEGKGCVLSLAMASKLTEYVTNLQIEEILQLDEQIVEKLLRMHLGPNRMQCGMLSVIALQKGLESYKNYKNNLLQ